MAGGGDGSVLDYPYDESKYKGFWKYFNNETPNGRAGTSAIWISVYVGAFLAYKLYRMKSAQPEKK